MHHTDQMSAIETHKTSLVEETQHEGWAVGWLTLGLALSYLGAFIGVYLVLRSSRWSARWKVTAIALPGILVVWTRAFPQHISTAVGTIFLFVTLAFVIWAVRGLRNAASNGHSQRRMDGISAFVAAVVVVAAAASVVPHIHPIDSYDLHHDVVTAAAAAADAGETYGVISSSSGWINGGGPTRAQADRLVGPGNARFAPLYDRLLNEEPDGPPGLSAKQLGTCYVFPVVKSLKVGIDSVEALSRFCLGPAQASGTMDLSDR